jgi:alpha-L-arabinofuranosidase
MENQISEVAAVCDYVKDCKRSRKKPWLSFYEWNVWYRRRGGDGKRERAPHLLEEAVWREAPLQKVIFSQVLTGTDLKAFNSFENPRRIAPLPFEAPKPAPRTVLQFPARSYMVIQWGRG